MCFSVVGCCCTVPPSVCSSSVHVLVLCLNVSVTFRSSKYARLLLVLNKALRCCKLVASLHSISMHVRLNIADRLKEAVGRPNQKPAVACRRKYSAKWEHIEHRMFLLTGPVESRSFELCGREVEVILRSTKKVFDSALTGEVTLTGWHLVA
jgi:hypothetical protein